MLKPLKAKTKPHFFDDVSSYFEKAARFTDFSPDFVRQISQGNTIYRFNLPVRQQEGMEVIDACRIEHSHHQLPGKGGVSYNGVMVLAALMTCKCAVVNVPLQRIERWYSNQSGEYSL